LSREDIKSEVHQAQDNSAEELDVVVPYKQWLAGDQRIEEFTDWFRSICGGSVIFKTIIESGQLPSEKHVQMAASEAIAGGADFVKTSTGKTKPAVTMISARVILETIKQHNSAAGLKVAGGINDWVTAESYVELAETIMTKYWVTPNKLRIGASKLLTI
jgi:deoxyribose-phosphate aldolase